MREKSTEYWQSLEGAPVTEPGPADGDPKQVSRRSFIQIMGLSAAAFGAACKRAPEMKLMPFNHQPEELTPGVPLWYATTCGACPAHCGLLVKARDGRPIKIEGNPEHAWSQGAVCAVGQASVLSLYDSDRAAFPTSKGTKTTWAALDREVVTGLGRARAAGQAIRLVTPAVLGPTEEAAVAAFLAAYPTARRVVFDALGVEAVAEAHRVTHGRALIPGHRFDRARAIVGFGADFLGTWLSPATYTRQYVQGRQPERDRTMSHHIQIEAALSLTGSNADHRILLAPSAELPALRYVARRLSEHLSYPGKAVLDPALAGAPPPRGLAKDLDDVASQLWTMRGQALVVSGSADIANQVAVNVINHILEGYGKTLELGAAPPGPAPQTFSELVTELRAGRVGALVFAGVNPAYAAPDGADLAPLLAKVGTTAAIGERGDETAHLVQHLAAAHHWLEAWSDASLPGGVVGLAQPLVAPLHETRAASETLLLWAGHKTDSLTFLRQRWEREVHPAAVKGAASFQAFWDQAVRDGFARVHPPSAAPQALRAPETARALAQASRPARGLELLLYAKVGLRDGALGNNGWLQELPDPITKVTWDNYAAVAPARAARAGLREGDVVRVSAGGRTIELPVLIQPGTHEDVVAVAVGYGRTRAGRIGNGVGVNAFPLAALHQGRLSLWRSGATLKRTGGRERFAKSQVHSSMEGRPLVREASLEEFLRNPRAGNPKDPEKHLSLWPEHKYEGHRWGMAIDLAACTGCSACVVSCQAENNIATVGKDEVRRRREMHWIRIDRYYQGSPRNPEVVHQPMTCMHCTNAPCETVCPVLATVHSTEGLNQQVYARCVGTRYCANNCPPKVRRFNWFAYDRSDTLANMVLNPDVTVRVRGVMEKCSLCVQRIQAGKQDAKIAKRPVRDGEIQTACQQSCPAGAIVFGDLNDPKSRLSQLVKSGRNYTILHELNLKPMVSYLTKIRNPGGRRS